MNGGFDYYDRDTYLYLVFGAISDMICVFSLTIAFMSDSSGFVGLLSYAIVVYGFLSDVIIFQESILALEILGACVIMVATLTVSGIKIHEGY